MSERVPVVALLRPFTPGPIEFTVVALQEDYPSPVVLAALSRQIDNGTVRLADIVVVRKSRDGEVTVIEMDMDELVTAGLDPLAPGLAGDEDLAAFAEHVAPDTAAAIVAFELSWAQELAANLAESGAAVVATARIPAPVANAIVDISSID